jgi:hypothetical protein
LKIEWWQPNCQRHLTLLYKAFSSIILDMAEPPKKLRGPISLLAENRRLRWAVALTLTAVLLTSVTIFACTQFRDLKGRLANVTSGMTREQVEELFGPPVLVMPRAAGRGTLLIWTDQLWQVDIKLGPDNRVESAGCMASDSAFRRTFGRPPGS